MEYWGFSICEADPTRSDRDTLTDLLTHVDIADRGGMDGWFFAEHHANRNYSLTPSPNLLIAAASQRTARIRLGNMVTVLAFHHPFRVAEEVRLLDALTSGRLEMGVGRGGFPHERAAWGLRPEEAEARFDAGFELILRFLTEDAVDYETPWWSGQAATAVPAPTQRPHPPMWLAVISAASLRLAAKLGLHCDTSFSYPELLHERMAMYRETWDLHHGDRPTGRFGVLVQVVVGETYRDAVVHGKQFVEQRLQRFMKGFGAAPAAADGRRRIYDHLSQLTFEGFIDDGLIIFGSSEHCAEQLHQLRATGVDVVTAWLRFEGMDEGFARASLERFVGDVIPAVEPPRTAEVSTPGTEVAGTRIG